jgi:propanediol dehydratase large subunit
LDSKSKTNLSGSYRIIGGKMKVIDIFNMMDELDSSSDDLRNSFDFFENFIAHYGIEGEGADEVESMVREIAKEEIRGHLLAIIDGTGDIISIASKLRTAAMDVDYKEYL